MWHILNLWFVFHVGERRRWEGIILYVMLVQQRVNSVVQLFFFPLTSFPLSFWPKHSDFALGQSFLLPSSSNNSRDIGLAYQRHIPDHKGLFRDGHVTSEPTRWNIGILAGNIEKGILFFFFFPSWFWTWKISSQFSSHHAEPKNEAKMETRRL